MSAAKKPKRLSLYKVSRKSVPAQWASRSAAAKACGTRGATVEQVASKLKIKVSTARNLVRWLAWNGYLQRLTR